MNSKAKNSSLAFFIIVLFLPLLQQYFPFIDSGRLYGWFRTAPDVTFSFKNWWDGSYQSAKSDYYNDNVGFRTDVIRINSQLDYSLFTRFRCDDVILGKENCLLPPEYLYPYLGRDFIGRDSIINQLVKLKALQDTFSRMGKSLVLIYAPCKAFYYADKIPDALISKNRSSTNYETCVNVADSLGINQVDMNAWFLKLRHNTKEVLYSSQGYHWSVYGSLIAADSFSRYIEKKRNIKMRHPFWTVVEHTRKPRDSDNDLALILNLIFPLTHETLTYPEVSYPSVASESKPSVVYIGDSFFFQWKNAGFMDAVNSNWEIWYYFKEIFRSHDEMGINHNPIAGDGWIKTLEKADCIVMMYTPHNVKKLGNGFIEQSYDYFYPSYKK